MTILATTLILALIYSAILLLNRNALRAHPLAWSTSHRVVSTVALISQFTVLYFHDRFWQNFLVYIVPLYGYFFIFTWAVLRRPKLASRLSVAQGLNGIFCNILGYYLFFYSGEFSLLDFNIAAVDKTHSLNRWNWWPVLVAMLCTVLVLYVIQFMRTSRKAELFLGLAFLLLLLPLFSPHVVWAMLLSSGLLLSTCILVTRKINVSEQLSFWIYSIGFFIVQLVMGIGLLIIS